MIEVLREIKKYIKNDDVDNVKKLLEKSDDNVVILLDNIYLGNNVKELEWLLKNGLYKRSYSSKSANKFPSIKYREWDRESYRGCARFRT